MFLYDEAGELWEVPEEDVELEEDGSGFWLLAAEGEDFEEFYAFADHGSLDRDD